MYSLHCSSKFDNEHREEIRKHYWSGKFAERRYWLNNYIEIKFKDGQDQGESCTLKYSLPSKDGVQLHVCKPMFLAPLGIKTDGMVTEFIHGKRAQPLRVPKDDKRGKCAAPNNKKDITIVQEHINSFNPQVSHYTLAHAPLWRYLEPNLTVVDMLENYK